MANELSSCGHSVEEEEYIDMDMSSTTFLCCHISSPNNIEFEFHLTANPSHTETAISSADELFYKGKLLPLHLPCRFQMVEKPLHNSETTYSDLNPEDRFHNCAIKSDEKKSWRKRLRIVRQSLLLAPKAYFKSLFTKTRRPEEADMANRGMKRSIGREVLADDCSQRKFLSPVFCSQASLAASLCFTSSSSFSSKKNLQQVLKKNCSMSSEMDSSILGAIAYCKMSQQFYSRECK